ncbi:MAG: AAA family ATPase [Tepidanaerobacteraceae bacterium]|jgi:DNA repair exonuclease SbcCD ATPase subunit|nr:AAA family ATPase [Tepidanaerobacteraceae bacterium]
MSYIKRIKLINFQSHKNSEIILDKGLTVILGPTDQGKSAIIRALKWVLYNEPRGTDFITVGCKYCAVTIEMNNGTIIIRERDGNKNRYILKKQNQEQIFEGFGNNVPHEITMAHGIPKIYIDRDSTSAVNLAEQLEAPFLVSESGSNRAKALGQLIGINVIDIAQRNTLKDLMEAEQHKRLIDNEILEIKEELKNYQDLQELENIMTVLKSLLDEIKQKRIKFMKLFEIKQKLEPTVHGINEACFDLKITENISDVEVIYSEMLDDINRIIALTALRDKLKETSRHIMLTKEYVDKTEDCFKAQDILNYIDKLNEKVQRYDQIQKKLFLLDRQIKEYSRQLETYVHIMDTENYMEKIVYKNAELLSIDAIRKNLYEVDLSIKKGQEYLTQLAQSLAMMTRQYALLLKKLSRCPTCLNPIDEITAQKIIVEMLKEGK